MTPTPRPDVTAGPWCRRMRRLAAALLLPGLLASTGAAWAQDVPEYRLKAAFVYNFIVYTEWPAGTPATLQLCVHGQDPFGRDIDALHDRVAAGRRLAVQRRAAGEGVAGCHVVFLSASLREAMPRVLQGLRGQPVLTVADSPDALRQGVMINMNLAQDKVSFEASLLAARAAGLSLSSKLLRLATEVIQ
jgi:hypothetical protein